MKKIKIIITIILIVFIILLFIPRKGILQDGGTVVYKSILYEVRFYHKRNIEDSKLKYIDGTQIKILNFEVYNNIKK